MVSEVGGGALEPLVGGAQAGHTAARGREKCAVREVHEALPLWQLQLARGRLRRLGQLKRRATRAVTRHVELLQRAAPRCEARLDRVACITERNILCVFRRIVLLPNSAAASNSNDKGINLKSVAPSNSNAQSYSNDKLIIILFLNNFCHN